MMPLFRRLLDAYALLLDDAAITPFCATLLRLILRRGEFMFIHAASAVLRDIMRAHAPRSECACCHMRDEQGA